jgi:hypothetical protein
MSEKNVERVRYYLEGYSRRSPDEREWVEENWDPDGDFYPVRQFPESRPCHGKDEISRLAADWRAGWGRLRFTIREIVSVGDDRVLAQITMSGEGRESGAMSEGELYDCYWLRHGRIFRQEHHLTAAGALRALGLEGESLEAAGLRE